MTTHSMKKTPCVIKFLDGEKKPMPNSLKTLSKNVKDFRKENPRIPEIFLPFPEKEFEIIKPFLPSIINPKDKHVGNTLKGFDEDQLKK